ncbi:MAG: hypothetical protein LBT81_06280 [Helicobacteraceae bacterium]|nr:hypothetical protein [Helicobacteraceae bacterium]
MRSVRHLANDLKAQTDKTIAMPRSAYETQPDAKAAIGKDQRLKIAAIIGETDGFVPYG